MFWVTTCRASEVLAHVEKVKASRSALCCMLWDTHKAVIYWNKLIQPSAQQSMLQLLLLFCCILKQHLIVLSVSLCHTPSGTREFCCVSEFFSFSLLMQETGFNEGYFLSSSHTSVYPSEWLVLFLISPFSRQYDIKCSFPGQWIQHFAGGRKCNICIGLTCNFLLHISILVRALFSISFSSPAVVIFS